jgi:hypothetical protein
MTILGMSSCSKDFLEVYPSNAVDVGLVFTTTQNAMGAVNGIHRMLYERYESDQDSGGYGAMMNVLDLMGEDVILGASPNRYVGVTRWISHCSETDRVTRFAWTFYNKVIANANLIIGNIDGAAGQQADRDMIKGQAYAYRGWAYFMLVQLYGKRWDSAGDNSSNLGVPLMTFESPEPKARNSVAEVYKLINEDLVKAIDLLAGYDRLNKSHINQSVAMGFLARVLLVQEQWEEAAKMADKAMAGYSFMTAAQHLEGYNDYENPEWMWSHKITGDQNTNVFDTFFAYMGYNFNSRAVKEGPRVINKQIYDKISATDVRKGKLWIPDSKTNPLVVTPEGMDPTRKADYMHQKFRAESESSSNGCVPCMRVAEMYLIAAEGYAKAGSSTLQTARDRLNALKKSRDPSYINTSAVQSVLIEDILMTRRIELWGEGYRFLDLKRLNLPLNRTGTNCVVSISVTMEVPAGDNRWQWKIPKTLEIDVNPLIEQNP